MAAEGQLGGGDVPPYPEAVAGLEPAAGEGHHKRRGRLSELRGNLLLMDGWMDVLLLINWLPDLHNLHNYILRPLTLIKSGLRIRTYL